MNLFFCLYSPAEIIVIALLAAVYSTVELVIWRLSEGNHSAVLTPPQRTASRRSALLLVAAWGIAFVGSMAIARLLHRPFSMPFYIAGCCLTALGLAIRVYCVRYLGNAFTANLSSGERHTLATTGPYRLVRHPSYTGSILALVGLSAAFASLCGILLTTSCATAVYLYRIKLEEAILIEKFGADYNNYKSKTRALLPLPRQIFK